VIVGVTSTPFKCPPAPSETALLMHDFLVRRGLRAPAVVLDSGLYVDGWIPVDPVEFGAEQVGRVEVTFLKGERPNGQFDQPSTLHADDKSEFGSSRIRRWFGRDWVAY
jgi:hypothetical protein